MLLNGSVSHFPLFISPFACAYMDNVADFFPYEDLAKIK